MDLKIGAVAKTQTPTIKMKSRKKVRRKQPITLYKEAVNDRYGPAPINPLRSLRTTGRIGSIHCGAIKGFSLNDLAEFAGVSKQAVIRTEQGVYPEIPKGILESLTNEPVNVPYSALVNGYEQFQLDTRRRHKYLFGSDVKFVNADHSNEVLRNNWHYPDGSPVGYEMNRTEMAKLLCISQSVIDYFENHPNRQQSVPFAINQALSQAGYPVGFLESFEQAYRAHRQYLFDKVV